LFYTPTALPAAGSLKNHLHFLSLKQPYLIQIKHPVRMQLSELFPCFGLDRFASGN
jgi:hypothetical protein